MIEFESTGKLLDSFFEGRDRETRVKQYASDLLKILSNAHSRIIKKLEIQRAELAECEKGEEYRRTGDLITANIYMLKRGMKSNFSSLVIIQFPQFAAPIHMRVSRTVCSSVG